MNIRNDSSDDGRRLSRRARAAILLLAVVALIGAGGLGLYLARTPAEPETTAVPAPTPAPAPAPAPASSSHESGMIAAVRLRKPWPAPDAALRDVAAGKPRIAAGERLKDAVGDFRLLKPGDDKLPNTTIIGKSGPKPPAARWTGPYAGVNLGGAVGTSALRTSIASPPDYFLRPDISQIGDLGSRSVSPAGIVGGAQLGYDYQRESLVVGLAADLDALPLSRRETQTGRYNSSPANTFSLSQSIRTDWLVTIRPRVGVAIDQLLFFGTGGLAMTRFKYDEEFTDTFSPALGRQSLSETRLGWTLGAGAEYALREHWSLKLEYLYADFGKVSTTSMLTRPPGKTDVFAHSATFNVHAVRLGLNYRF